MDLPKIGEIITIEYYYYGKHHIHTAQVFWIDHAHELTQLCIGLSSDITLIHERNGTWTLGASSMGGRLITQPDSGTIIFRNQQGKIL